MKETQQLGKPDAVGQSWFNDLSWFQFFLVSVLPLTLIGLAWNLSAHDLFRGAIPFNVLLFFAIGALLEGASCLIWIFRERFSAQIVALVAGIFVSALPVTVSLFLFDRAALLFILITVIGLVILILILIETWGLSTKARTLARETLERRLVFRWVMLGCLVSLFCCWTPYLVYNQLRPEIEEIPMFVAASDIESTDWSSWDSGGSIEREGRFITSASAEEVLHSYKQVLEKQGWRLVDEEVLVPERGFTKELTRLCCYS